MDLCQQNNVCFLICCLGWSWLFFQGASVLISWLQSPSAVILEPKKIKSVTVSIVSPSICHEVMGLDALIFFFWMLKFKPAFSFSSFTFMKSLFSSSFLSLIRSVSSAYLRLLIFLPAVLIPACASSSPTFHMIYSAFPSPGDLPNPGIKPKSPTLQADSLPAEPQGKPRNTGVGSLSLR